MDAPPIQYARTDDGVNIAYSAVGDRPPLFAAEGGMRLGIQSEFRYERVRAWYERLGQGRTLILFDPRGAGSSDRDISDLSIAAQIRDAEAVL